MPQAAAELYTREDKSPTKNLLTVKGENLRRVVLFLKLSASGRQQLRHQIPWWVSCYATLQSPGTTLAPLANPPENVNLAPSRLRLPPLGANLMHVATAYWPPVPPIASISFYFCTEADEPSNAAWAWGFPDATPHDYSGLWVMPFGSGPMMSRLDEDDEPSAERLARELADNPGLSQRVTELVADARAVEIAEAFRRYPRVGDDARKILSSRRTP
jgi:hypothetical protein